ncbi:MAG: ABC transporter permease, partial [Acidobacteriaceae bacterium]|nr:ABC transporter permease [Acidobacteriaceae bacterium]
MFWRRRRQPDFSAEIESHLALEADRLRAEGLSEADAKNAARRAFGNLTKTEERFYERQHPLWLEDLQKDLRHGFRLVLHQPAFAATVVLTLALGIGATTAIFSVIDAALIRPLPFPESNRLMSPYERWQGDLGSIAPADYIEYCEQGKAFESLAAYRDESFNLSGQNRPERVIGAIVTPNFFRVFKVPPQLGRTLNPSEDKPGTTRTVV